MIVEGLVEFALSIFDLILSIIPDMDFSGFSEACDYFFSVLAGICYFLPMDTIGAIVSIIYSLFIFRLLISILKTIWSIIPIL